ncbi:MAG: phosphoglycerate kinase [Methylacidiphilales bacterium]|nr:phosphoglycerate kinase [Candidatus Methylacidiphilales bacterium]
MKQIPYKSFKNKKILCREDLNVPTTYHNGKHTITSLNKFYATQSNLKPLLEAGAQVGILTHFGRPANDGSDQKEYSVEFMVTVLRDLYKVPVTFCSSIQNKTIPFRSKEIILFENVRLNAGETSNDEVLADRYNSMCDVYIFNAFATSHRAHSSTEAIIKIAKEVYLGPLVEYEIKQLDTAMNNPTRPLIAIIGGKKVSTKFDLINNMLNFVDTLIVGGGIANTFLKSNGINIGSSICEDNFLEQSNNLLNNKGKNKIILPIDVITAKSIDSRIGNNVTISKGVANDEMILDIGTQTALHYSSIIKQAKTILWNGPLGVIEKDLFKDGTKVIAQAINKSDAFVIAGGGETVFAIEMFGISNRINYLSTGGGAFLEYLNGTKLPSLKAFEKRKKS